MLKTMKIGFYNSLCKALFIVVSFTAGLLQSVYSEEYVPNEAVPATEPWRWTFFNSPELMDTKCLLKASNGDLWVATSDRIYRYNGLAWESFSEADGVAAMHAKGFSESADGTIFFSNREILYQFKNNQWGSVFQSKRPSFYKPRVTFSQPNGDLWVGLGIGLLQIHEERKILWAPRVTLPAAALADNFDEIGKFNSPDITNLKNLEPIEELDSSSWKRMVGITQACRGADDSIWICTSKQKIYRVTFDTNGSTPRFTELVPPKKLSIEPRCQHILEDSQGFLWVITKGYNNKVYRINPRSNEWVLMNPGFPEESPKFLKFTTETDDGTIWVCGETRLLYYKKGIWNMVHTGDLPVSSANIFKIESFSDSSLWIVFSGKGFARLDLSNADYVTYNDLHFHAEAPNGSQWFISSNKQVIRKQNDQWDSYGPSNGLMDLPVRIFSTRSGNIWASGSHRKKAATAWFDGKKWKRVVHSDFASDTHLDVVFEDNERNVWFGALSLTPKRRDGGLIRYHKNSLGEHLFEYVPASQRADRFTAGMAQDHTGKIILGGDQLKQMSGKRIRLFSDDRIPRQHRAYVEPAEDGVWIVSNNKRMYYLGENKLNTYSHSFMVWGNNIRGIVDGGNQCLWLGSEQGIYWFDGYEWSNQVFHENLADSKKIFSLYKSPNNMLWINQANFDRKSPHSMRTYKTTGYRRSLDPPDTTIMQGVDSVRHMQSEPLFLEWSGSDSWNKTPADQLYFSFRVNGGEWSPFEKKNRHVLQNLQVGTHRFEVRARDWDLNMDPTPAMLEFTVIGPLWRQPWFIIMIACFTAIILFLVGWLTRLHGLRVTEQLLHEKEQAEQQQRIEHFRLEFFTNISHELRTPLTLILGPLEKALATLKTPELREPLQIAQRNGQRLLALINQLLDMRKLDEGGLQLDLTEADLSSFIGSIVQRFQSMADQKSISLIYLAKEELLTLFDADKMDKIITNLLSNALKFTPETGEIIVDVEMDKSIITITVKDTGMGIPESYHEKIFERFRQKPTENQQQGSGIGLALTKELIELHGGSISIESPLNPANPDRPGAEFVVQLPVPSNQDALVVQDGETPVETVKAQPNGEGFQILIVEDNPDMRRFIRLELEPDYVVIEAEDGRQGFDMALENVPDLIVSDVLMPHMDGFELCLAVRENMLTSHIPIILLTARGAQKAEIEGLKTGANDYVVKPFNREVLKLRIKNQLEIRQQRQERYSSSEGLEPEEPSLSPKDSEFLEKAEKIIGEHLDDPDFSSTDFCRYMGLSRSGLYKKIKALTGQSANVFIRTTRLRHGARLLLESELNISEIAFRVGFTSHAYFSRCFSELFGMSPSRYIETFGNR